LKLILKPVDLFPQGASQEGMVVKKPRAERGDTFSIFCGYQRILTGGSKTNIYETSGAESGWKRPKTVIRGVDLRSIEDTAVIELLRTRPERTVER
jgi:hypothetical protein